MQMIEERAELGIEPNGEAPSKLWKRVVFKSVLIASVAGVTGGLLAAGLSQRTEAHAELVSAAKGKEVPIVRVTAVKEVSAPQSITLPGTIRASQATAIRSRANGFIKKWHADIGQVVQEGDLLTEIDTPELDHELQQIAARLKQSETRLELATASLQRIRQLAAEKISSQQELDEAVATERAASSDVAAARANLQRLEELQRFKKVVAPFSGRVTARNVDVGDLVTAGAGSMELFRLVQTSPFRMYVDVPQSYMRSVEEGMQAQVLAREYQGSIFAGKVVRTSGAIDPISRTLRVEIELPNETQELLPGMYAEVKLTSTTAIAKLRIPSTAILFSSKGPSVALVDAKNLVRLRNVKLGRDFGMEIEVASGLTAEDVVIANPTDALSDGMKVSVHQPAKQLPAKS